MKRLAFALLLLLAVACNRDESAKALAQAETEAAPIGDAERGKALTAQYGCNVCHVVPGIGGPQGSLGPSLAGLASRPAISFNTVQNTPENLAKYIQNPASLNPQSSMPPIGLTDVEAKDIAAYLLALK
jgi:cytochrome c